jgi:hypothetical protein
MTTTELARLADAISRIRPDWPAQSLLTFLSDNLATRAYRDTAVAMIWIAVDRGTRTPKRVLEPGPWWNAAGTTDVPTTRNDCPTHPETGIRVDARTGDRTCAGCHVDRNENPDATASFTRRPAPDAVRAMAGRIATPERATPTHTDEELTR